LKIFMTPQLFKDFPRLNTLRTLVSDEIILREVTPLVEEYQADLAEAQKLIPTVNLNQVFPEIIEKDSIYLENFFGHWGCVSIEELCKICLIVKFIKPKRILEIGTYIGLTTLQMALNAPADCLTYTLDIPKENRVKIAPSVIDELVAQSFKQEFNTMTGSYFKERHDVNIKQLWGDSATFDYSVLDRKADLIFIDAAHDYQSKKIDSENAFKLIADGGVIIWHNYADVLNAQTTKYLKDISANYHLFHLRNTFLVVFWNKK